MPPVTSDAPQPGMLCTEKRGTWQSSQGQAARVSHMNRSCEHLGGLPPAEPNLCCGNISQMAHPSPWAEFLPQLTMSMTRAEYELFTQNEGWTSKARCAGFRSWKSRGPFFSVSLLVSCVQQPRSPSLCHWRLLCVLLGHYCWTYLKSRMASS